MLHKLTIRLIGALPAALFIAPLLASGVSAQSTKNPPTSSTPQIQDGTYATKPAPFFTAGKLTGCVVDFIVTARDNINKRGDYILLAGSFGIMSPKQNNFVAILDLAVQDLDIKTGNRRPDTPASAYIVSTGIRDSHEVFVAGPSSTPGGIFVTHKWSVKSTVFNDLKDNNKLDIAFVQKKNGKEMRFTVETDVKSMESGKQLRDPENMREYVECVGKLTQPS